MIKNIAILMFVFLIAIQEIQAQVSISGVNTYSTIGGNFRTRTSKCKTGFGFRCLSVKPSKVIFDVTITKKGTNFDRVSNNMAGVIRIIDENTAQFIVDKEIGISPDFYKEVFGSGYFEIEQGESLQEEVLDILDYKSAFPIKAGKYPVQQDKDYLIIVLKKG